MFHRNCGVTVVTHVSRSISVTRDWSPPLSKLPVNYRPSYPTLVNYQARIFYATLLRQPKQCVSAGHAVTSLELSIEPWRLHFKRKRRFINILFFSSFKGPSHPSLFFSFEELQKLINILCFPLPLSSYLQLSDVVHHVDREEAAYAKNTLFSCRIHHWHVQEPSFPVAFAAVRSSKVLVSKSKKKCLFLYWWLSHMSSTAIEKMLIEFVLTLTHRPLSSWCNNVPMFPCLLRLVVLIF